MPTTLQEYATPAGADRPGDRNVGDSLFAHERDHPDAPLLAIEEGGAWRDLTAAQVIGRVRRLAAGLIAAGIQPGERVALLSHTRLEWTLCDYAIGAAGAVTVPIYETSSAEQIEWILSDSGARAAFCELGSHRDTIASLRGRLPDLGDLWCFEDDDLAKLTDLGAGVTAEAVEERRAAVGPDDLASIVYTSGTTGRPKGCRLTHGNCLAELYAMVPNLPELFGPEGSTLLFLPLAHIFGRAVQIASVATRTRMGYCSDTSQLVADLQSFRPTFVLSVPRVFEKVYNTAKHRAHAGGGGGLGSARSALTGRLFDDAEATAIAWSEAQLAGRVPPLLEAKHALFERLVYAKLRAAMGGRARWAISGGGPLGARLGHFFNGAGVTILEAYGLTETLGAVTANWPADKRIGSVGRPIPGDTIRIAEDGEVLARGGNVFPGYWHNDEATAATFEDGWFRTGDIGELDGGGFLTITGRKKELIVTAAGKNVAPAVLEDRLRAHPLVSQCMVVGDNRPFIACLVTVDADVWGTWAAEHGKAGAIADHVADADLVAAVQAGVDDANKAVSRAESIRRFVILPSDFTEESGEITPTLKLKRSVVAARWSDAIDGLYA